MKITCTAFVLLIQTLQCLASDGTVFQRFLEFLIRIMFTLYMRLLCPFLCVIVYIVCLLCVLNKLLYQLNIKVISVLLFVSVFCRRDDCHLGYSANIVSINV